MTRKRVVVLAVALAGAGLVVAVVAFAGLIYFTINGFSGRPANEAEQRLVIATARFAPFEIEGLGDMKPAVLTRHTLDGTREVEWEFENQHFFYHSTAEICRSSRAARESYKLTLGAWKTGMALGGSTVEEAPSLLHGGDERFAGFVIRDRKRVGNVFLVRNGRVLHSLMITGITFEEPTEVQQLFDPLIAESKRQYGT